MGLVGLILVPIASQTSVDYLDTRDFAMRPRRWLELISENLATISFSPPFGYELVELNISIYGMIFVENFLKYVLVKFKEFQKIVVFY